MSRLRDFFKIAIGFPFSPVLRLGLHISYVEHGVPWHQGIVAAGLLFGLFCLNHPEKAEAAYVGSAPLLVANGGTGATTLAAHGVLLGEGTSAIAATAVGTNGQMFLGATSADPGWQTMSGDATLGTTGVITLATVNGAGGTCTLCTITSNAKGLVTSFSSGSATIPTLATATGASPITITATNLLTTVVSMATPAAATINLPTAVQTAGFRECVKDGTTNWGTNNATIKSPTSGTIDGVAGATGVVANQAHEELCFISDATNWFVE
jgi:hypothetical protein